MPLPAPSTVIRCEDIASCFQAIYNFFFAILIALAFLNFLYGAFLYLLSGGGISQKEEGKKKMTNSIISVIVVMIIPIILNMVNPGIFNVELEIPVVKITLPETAYKGEDYLLPSPPDLKKDFVWLDEFIREKGLKCLKSFPEVQVNIQMIPYLISLDRELCNRNIIAVITSGYRIDYGSSPCHTETGTCIDIIVSYSTFPCEPWQKLGFALKAAGFSKIIYETKTRTEVRGCQFLWRDDCGIDWQQCELTTGPHIHAAI